MHTLQNPILRGFNPDPSIVRVGEDYFIATSTFEWFPGVQIHHSRDLVNWQVVAQPLNRVSQLDLKGIPDSCGVWAPCLSYDDGTFYLVYSNVQSFDGPWKDTPNYLVTANDVAGVWSSPTYLGSSGFDGSLFHDDDGRKWFISMRVDHRQEDFFGGIILQKYDPLQKKLVGEVFLLTKGTSVGKTEGPHLYRKDGYYYLLLAEGGTEYGHAASMMRSRSITGPYEAHPGNPILTSRDDPDLALQKAGHASIVASPDGHWYIVFLVGRPLSPRGRCILGRETAIAELAWVEGWPVLKHGTNQPRLELPASLQSGPVHEPGIQDDFEADTLSLQYQSLRMPMEESWCSLNRRKGFLSLKGRESLSSTHQQSMVARRVQSYTIEASTCVVFEPDTFQQMAGLVFYYNTGHYHYLNITANDEGTRKLLTLLSSDNFRAQHHDAVVDITGHDSVILKGKLNHSELQFFYSLDGHAFTPIGPVLDASILSDDYVRDGGLRYQAAFTGCFVGMCCQDLACKMRCDLGGHELNIGPSISNQSTYSVGRGKRSSRK